MKRMSPRWVPSPFGRDTRGDGRSTIVQLDRGMAMWRAFGVEPDGTCRGALEYPAIPDEMQGGISGAIPVRVLELLAKDNYPAPVRRKEDV